MKILHNPRCTKSRQALALLEEAGVEVEVVRYLETPPSVEELGEILDRLGMEPRELLRRGEAIYRELGLKDADLSREEVIRVMVENPKLIERPIVVDGNRAVVGRPPENVLSLLE